MLREQETTDAAAPLRSVSSCCCCHLDDVYAWFSQSGLPTHEVAHGAAQTAWEVGYQMLLTCIF